MSQVGARSGRWWYLALLAVLAAGVGWWLQWSELLGVGTGLGAIALVVGLLPRPREVSWQDVAIPTRVVRGDAAQVRIAVALRGSARWVRAVDSSTFTRMNLPGAGELCWPIDTRRRGRYRCGPDHLAFADPLGLRRSVLAKREQTEVLIVPRVTAMPQVAAGSRMLEGSHDERAGSEQFVALRDYVVGDPRKLIHWRASAHAGNLLVRRTVDVTVPTVLVVLDVDRRSHVAARTLFGEFDPEAFEEAVDVAASWAWSNCLPGRRVLVTTTMADAPVVEASASNRDGVLDWLALVEPCADDACLPARVVPLTRRNSVGQVILVTGASAGRSGVGLSLRQAADQAGLVLRVVSPGA